MNPLRIILTALAVPTVIVCCAASPLNSFAQPLGGDAFQGAGWGQIVLTAEEPKKESGSFLDGIWENFSSKFRPDEKPAAPVDAKPEKPLNRRAIARPKIEDKELLKLINDYRSKKKLKPLSIDPRAVKAAQALSADMAKNDKMSHYGPDGADVGKRLTASGYNYKLAAENVGVGQSSLKEMIDDWEKSPPHSKNMLLSGAKHIGLAVEYSPSTKYQTFWTLVIAAPAS